jgi:TctA family transporter
MESVALAFSLVLDPYVLAVILGASLFGLFVGAIPGLTATMATALLVPVTFFMPPVPAVAAIVSCTAMAIFSGDIPGALLRMPGTPASAAYTDEAYAMTRKGQAELVLGAGLVFSAIGGLLGTIVLVTGAVFIASDRPLKGFVSLMLGLLVSTIGLNNPAAHPRFTFESEQLLGGVSFIPLMIGMFAVSEVLRYVATQGSGHLHLAQEKFGNVFKGQWALVRQYPLAILRGSGVGTAIGALPGAGADIAAWISYAISKKFSRTPEKFGTGHVEGVVESGAANNGALSGAWIPALVFGIPGDSITAIAIGVLYMKGMNPGPTIFLNNPENIYAVFIVFFLANLLMIPLGLLAIKLYKQILRVPRGVLMPLILSFCLVGAFAINNTAFDIGVMLVAGVIAFFMERNGFPIAPAILGVVLGGMFEENLATSLMKAEGSWLAFFERPIAGALGVATVLVWLTPLALAWRRRAKAAVA